ncbi:alpha/beta fold hydrolase [Pseudobdellovibrio exovorus]|uniref:Hydrolase or acyltransferase n=1 Tax=Pseudobdellovibrio exovorus JSS TaxID=1184267 RepID=M4V8C6_9BACT|nr:alpha/beta fold hydrolase [Pseudobdellovibrio exovorus]AGH94705.1 hydrolase or acyltransferase [Pseudobdellovibrio exovorus JSS]
MSSGVKPFVFALHGFLGQSSDWNQIQQKLKDSVDFHALDLFSKDSSVITDLSSYTSELAVQIQQRQSESFSTQDIKSRKRIFVGYSLGGRLGLHLLLNHSDLFDVYIFLSTNVGLPTSAYEERQQRIASDQRWAQQISESSWDLFLQKWNAQAVFAGSLQEPARHKSDYDLQKLQQSLDLWSVGRQQSFAEVVKEHQHKVHWIVGHRDTKYLNAAQNLHEQGCLQEVVPIDSGHRVWCDNPIAVANCIRQSI